jgi:hypothetical protein
MNAITVICASALVIFGCTHAPPTKEAAPVPVEGKLTAPVALEAEVSDRSARVTVRFEHKATDVNVNVWGVDGLEVVGARTVVGEAAFSEGETKVFDVAFTRGIGRSHLVVGVTGQFAGQRLQRAVTFAVGTPTDPQVAGEGARMTTDDGQRIRVMPADPQQ